MPTYALLLFLLLLCHSAAAHRRRILHQAFFPLDTFPPAHSPTPSPPSAPKYPFSTATPAAPFFPSSASPPPPPPSSPATLTSFPANISSLAVPQSPTSKSASSKLIAFAAASVIAAVVIVSIAVTLQLRRRNRSSSCDTKTRRSDNDSNVGGTANCNAHRIPKLQRPSQTSAEFLYLGTIVSSAAHGGGNDSRIVAQSENSSTLTGSGVSSSRKVDSPELRPLPPLNSYRRIYTNAAAAPCKDDVDEEFYSPKGSLNGRDSPVGTGSASRRTFAAIEVDNFNGLVSNSSSSCSSSVSGLVSGSLVRSMSVSLSPENSLSPIKPIPRSPDLIEIPVASPFHRPLRSANESESPSPPSSSSPDRYSRASLESSPRISNASDRIAGSESPLGKGSSIVHEVDVVNPILHPPPPPPPPPPPLLAVVGKNLDSPRTPTPPAKKQASLQPALVTPFRPIAAKSPPLVSPVELPANDSETNKFSTNENEEECSNETIEQNEEEITTKPKLKPLHWDKVRASSDREMVWDQLKSSSFKLNEEMIETLFLVNTPTPYLKEKTRWQVLPTPGPDSGNRVLDPKKAQNIAILLRALNVTIEEVCEGLSEGNADILGTELLESLMKMAPTKEEERKLKEYKDDSPHKLGTAEKFLKAVLDIPCAFKRVNVMLYVSNFDSEVEYLRKSFRTLEAACEELRTSRMFLKLLEAVLKTGNRMNVGTNRGDAHAFKLDTLLKLVDVKGADGKTTLLHFVVQEIIRSEGARLSNVNQIDKSSIDDDAKCRKIGLQIVSGLSSELSNVKKAAAMDSDVLSTDVSKLSNGIGNIAEVARLLDEIPLEDTRSHKFSESMDLFMKRAEEDIIQIQALESVALSLVKEITEYFHGNSVKEEAHPFRIFLVVRDFLTILDRVCKEVGMINERTIISSAHKFPVPVNPTLQPVSGGFLNGKKCTSSDDDSSSP